ncbi:hypothetical protein AUC43_07835 [Hymenobacter sedentarius]|uniref:Zinc-finger domain-containing protein n=1 Tax=Hymenobacter sedentarius TaxID=1411621 RepID=A0A0U4C1V0_9BACT|nr:hypothetical protein [Hymenobacter sedentarius]ALW85010.1 hypothetical protein AUC43_07835 [Hymenobacter sedentarius]
MDQSATTKTNTSAPVALAPDNGPDCERVNTVLDQLIEGQPVTAEDEDYLYDHASDCSPCFDDIKKQHIFINFLNQGVSRRPIPANLHDSILARVHAEMA